MAKPQYIICRAVPNRMHEALLDTPEIRRWIEPGGHISPTLFDDYGTAERIAAGIGGIVVRTVNPLPPDRRKTNKPKHRQSRKTT